MNNNTSNRRDEIKNKYLYQAKIYEKEEKYENTIKQMKCYFNQEIFKYELNQEERNLFFGSYKNILRQKRSARRLAIEENNNLIDEIFQLQIISKLTNEINLLCQEVIDIVNSIIEFSSSSTVSKNGTLNSISSLPITQEYLIFLNVVKADYYRYLCEITIGFELKSLIKQANHCYFLATKYANQSSNLSITSTTSPSPSSSSSTAIISFSFFSSTIKECVLDTSTEQYLLSPLHPTILGLVLNYTVFLSEIMNDTNQAIQLSREVYSDGFHLLL